MANEKTSALARNILKITIKPAVMDMRRRAAEVVKRRLGRSKAGQAAMAAILALPLDPAYVPIGER